MHFYGDLCNKPNKDCILLLAHLGRLIPIKLQFPDPIADFFLLSVNMYIWQTGHHEFLTDIHPFLFHSIVPLPARHSLVSSSDNTPPFRMSFMILSFSFSTILNGKT